MANGFGVLCCECHTLMGPTTSRKNWRTTSCGCPVSVSGTYGSASCGVQSVIQYSQQVRRPQVRAQVFHIAVLTCADILSG